MEKMTLNRTVREAIFQALLRLMKTMPLPEITVSELAEVAGVSRSSFYRNFGAKENVLSVGVREMYAAFLHREGENVERTAADRGAFLISRFRFIRENRELFTLLRKNNMLLTVFETLGDEMILRLSGLAPEAPEYYAALSAGACAGVVRQWIDNSFRESPEEMAALLSAVPWREMPLGRMPW